MSCEPSQFFPVEDYDLEATLNSGQAFRWSPEQGGWTGVVGNRWVWLTADSAGIRARVAVPPADWRWLADYLQVEAPLAAIYATFPADAPMQAALAACHGLRLLRQNPWECLASFILSSTKQIVQIRQVIDALCRRFGEPLSAPAGFAPAWSFPGPRVVANLSEAELRACKMGFRAPYLRVAARRVADGELDLEMVRTLSLEEARERLTSLPGVGIKIADCALLFAYGFSQAFPIDIWVSKAIKELYFSPRARGGLNAAKIIKFTETYFGPNSGYAQQYLFHYMRTRNRDREDFQAG